MLSSAVIQEILAGILAAIKAAPQVEAVITAAKNWISALFGAKLISQDTQNVLHAWVDNQAALALLGIVPPSWQVEPDPDVIPGGSPKPAPPTLATP